MPAVVCEQTHPGQAMSVHRPETTSAIASGEIDRGRHRLALDQGILGEERAANGDRVDRAALRENSGGHARGGESRPHHADRGAGLTATTRMIDNDSSVLCRVLNRVTVLFGARR